MNIIRQDFASVNLSGERNREEIRKMTRCRKDFQKTRPVRRQWSREQGACAFWWSGYQNFPLEWLKPPEFTDVPPPLPELRSM